MPDRTEREGIKREHRNLFFVAEAFKNINCDGISCSECPFGSLDGCIEIVNKFDELTAVRERLGIYNAENRTNPSTSHT